MRIPHEHNLFLQIREIVSQHHDFDSTAIFLSIQCTQAELEAAVAVKWFLQDNHIPCDIVCQKSLFKVRILDEAFLKETVPAPTRRSFLGIFMNLWMEEAIESPSYRNTYMYFNVTNRRNVTRFTPQQFADESCESVGEIFFREMLGACTPKEDGTPADSDITNELIENNPDPVNTIEMGPAMVLSKRVLNMLGLSLYTDTFALAAVDIPSRVSEYYHALCKAGMDPAEVMRMYSSADVTTLKFLKLILDHSERWLDGIFLSFIPFEDVPEGYSRTVFMKAVNMLGSLRDAPFCLVEIQERCEKGSLLPVDPSSVIARNDDRWFAVIQTYPGAPYDIVRISHNNGGDGSKNLARTIIRGADRDKLKKDLRNMQRETDLRIHASAMQTSAPADHE